MYEITKYIIDCDIQRQQIKPVQPVQNIKIEEKIKQDTKRIID